MENVKNEVLNCYASGDGALHFCWLLGGVATGRHTTMQDVKRFLRSKNGKWWREKGYKAVLINTLPCIVAPVRRTGANEVSLYDRTYKYQSTETEKGEHRAHSTKVTTIMDRYDDGTTVIPERTVEVKHISTIMAIVHFLNHEQEIASQSR